VLLPGRVFLLGNPAGLRLRKDIPRPSYCWVPIYDQAAMWDVVNRVVATHTNMRSVVGPGGPGIGALQYNTSTLTTTLRQSFDLDTSHFAGLAVVGMAGSAASSRVTISSADPNATVRVVAGGALEVFGYNSGPISGIPLTTVKADGRGTLTSVAMRMSDASSAAFCDGVRNVESANTTYWNSVTTSSFAVYNGGGGNASSLIAYLGAAWHGEVPSDDFLEEASLRPQMIFEAPKVWVPVSVGATLPTLSASTYVAGSLTSTGWRPQVTAT
jgi:hypothetical protein